jgi:hypothetical protein
LISIIDYAIERKENFGQCWKILVAKFPIVNSGNQKFSNWFFWGIDKNISGSENNFKCPINGWDQITLE